MSEAVVWPIVGSEQELPIDKSEVEADIIPFPNRTGLLFNKVTEQELTDYIGQAAKNIGVGLNLGWSESYGICFNFSDDESISRFDELLCQFEQQQAGKHWNPQNPGASARFCLTELPASEIIYLLAEDQDQEQMRVKPSYKTVCLTPFIEAEDNPGTRADKINRYDFADFLLRIQEKD